MTERRCTAKTKKGKPCKSTSLVDGTDRCFSHQPKEVRRSHRFGGAQEGAGRPPKPKAIEVLRAQVEDEIEQWLAPLRRARDAERAVVVGNGPSAHVEFVPDIPTQVTATREVLDRLYGRPKQTQEVTGAGGQPLVAPDLPTDGDWREDVRRALRDLDGPVAVNGSRNGHG